MTKKPLATISFNSPPFLRNVCNQLVEDGKIQSWMYILHKAEEDTKKDHIHLILIPCCTVNPVAVRKAFIEPCVCGLDLGALPFVPSKIGDWLLYALHYEPYLFSKGLIRLHHYEICDIVSNESRDYVEQCFSEAKESLTTSRIKCVLERMAQGATFGELLSEGIIPPNHIVFYEKLFKTNAYRSRVKHCHTILANAKGLCYNTAASTDWEQDLKQKQMKGK